ncbi:YopX family protein [Sporosarcina contaminans]|uniref:YopX family protein n=1 Tax=Sporosarcina contaminans TaxID=633403 RepID=A0ABW3U1J0_9BACL
MSRVNKYRGKDKKTGQWVYGSYVATAVGLHYIIPQNLISNVLPEWIVDKESVGQFTGLHDKTGVEIYEGDVLKIPDLYETPENTHATYHNETVYFEQGAFRTVNGKLDEDWDYLSEESEVIGNIYENPELLEVAQ